MEFKKGDIIEWCDEHYEVIDFNNGYGIVKDGNGDIIRNFNFSFGGEIAKKIS